MKNNQPKRPKMPVNAQKCYIVELSNGRRIKCDVDEVSRVIDAIKTGGVCKLKQGLFNPSFFVNIIEDEDRQWEFIEKVNEITRHNHQDKNYMGNRDQKEYPTGLEPLKDIFDGVKLLSGEDKTKKLN